MTTTLSLVIPALLTLAIPLVLLVAVVTFMRAGWWPSLLWKLPYRPVSIVAGLFASFALILVFCACVFRIENALSISFALWLLLAPIVVIPATAWLAWWRDPKTRRGDAATIRNRLQELHNQPLRVASERVWREYILDAQRAAQQARYTPPE